MSPGWKTNYNRYVHGIPEAHHYDALFCGNAPESGYRNVVQPCLVVKAMGRGTRLLGQINKCGIITVKYRDHHKRVNGLQTGDIVRVVTPNGKYKGKHIGRIMIRSRGDHDIRRLDNKKVGTTRKSVIQVIQRVDGYQYSLEKAIPLGN